VCVCVSFNRLKLAKVTAEVLIQRVGVPEEKWEKPTPADAGGANPVVLAISSEQSAGC